MLRLALGSLEEACFEVQVVDVEVAVTLPQEVSVTCSHRLWQNKADIDKHGNRLSHSFLIDLLTIAVSGDAVKNRFSNMLFRLAVYFLFKDLQTSVANKRHVRVSQIVAI